jgi:beta-xylosidase
VVQRDGTYHLYYTVTDRGSGRQCISHAESRRPEGPYLDLSTWALVCQLDRGGSIDPSPFVERDGSLWLAWKSEGIPGREPARLWSQRLTGDGRGLVGRPGELLVARPDGWEAGVVEAPAMTRAGDTVVLFYSGNRWDSPAYAVGAARCATPAGPCTRTGPGPLLVSGGLGAGPGSLEVFRELGGAPAAVYHAWDGPRVGYPQGRRTMRIGRLTFGPAGPAVQAR